jgi:hypothetical protein
VRPDPLTQTLEATSDLLPLLGKREARFSLTQRAQWDTATEAFALAWEKCQTNFALPNTAFPAQQDNMPWAQAPLAAPSTWTPLRRAIFRLLEGALPLNHPAPLELAEALASATDDLEMRPPTPRLITALAASAELLQEKDFLENEALESLAEQMANRLAHSHEGVRTLAACQTFSREAQEEMTQMRTALECLPPDTEQLACSGHLLQALAETLELSSLAVAAFRFARLMEKLLPASLDREPGRNEALGWIDVMENWLVAIETGDIPPPPPALETHCAHLSLLLS